MNARIGATGIDARRLAILWVAAAAAASAAWAVKLGLGTGRPLVLAAVALPLYGAVYLGVCAAGGVPESRALVARARRAAP